ncbi:MAG: glutamine--fructose-6-phosphate transaminase (isomerizing) [SAR202 cluster bacterium]|nr:glutamine--fructose-6-phosphate transaminase (isomerizing) [SAR202 cluster bacterium]
MCGILGCFGSENPYSLIRSSLQRLEYRGYDSCGVAISDRDKIHSYKVSGPVSGLIQRAEISGAISGLGHTRWATVGTPSAENAHPFMDCNADIAIVHNGDLDNFIELRESLLLRGHHFSSDTDSEVFAHLIEESESNLEPIQRVNSILSKVTGSYALGVLFRSSGVIVGARHESPLVIGTNSSGGFLCSDVHAIAPYVDHVIHLEDGDLALLDTTGVSLFHGDKPVTRTSHPVSWDPAEVDKAGFDHYFLKEVFEQPKIIRNSLEGRVRLTNPTIDLANELPNMPITGKIGVFGCGSAFNAGLLGATIVSELIDQEVGAHVSSNYNRRLLTKDLALAVFLSQSGETADTLATLKVAKSAGIKTIAITNVPNSSITRLAEFTLLNKAGLEESVGASKTFTSQVIDFVLLCLWLNQTDISSLNDTIVDMHNLSNHLDHILDTYQSMEDIALTISNASSIFIIGKNLSYPIALEASLKFKELAYIHAEAIMSGEIKHGTFALLTSETPVIAIAKSGDQYKDVVQTVREIKARNAPVIVITDQADAFLNVADAVVTVESSLPIGFSLEASMIFQLLAYRAAIAKGCPIDRPRNLAKSVTVK